MIKKNNLDNLSIGYEEEKYLVDVYSKGKLFAKNIKAKFVIDNLITSNSICYLYPSNEMYDKIAGLFEFELKGYFKNTEGKKTRCIHMTKGYHLGAERTFFPKQWRENIIKIHPSVIWLKYFLEKKQKEPIKDEEKEIILHITNNKMVQSWGFIEKDFDGIKKNTTPRVSLDLKGGEKLIFDDCLNSEDIEIRENKGTFCYNRQIIKLLPRTVITYEAIKDLLLKIESLLWFLSFATRQMTTWSQWSGKIGNEITRHIRCNVTYPKTILLEQEDALIELGLLQDFLSHCLKRIENPPNNALDLYLPIVYLLGSSNKTAEGRFLSLFMSLEALLNLFAEKDSSVSSKATFREKYKKFCNVRGVDCSDLWAMFGKKTEKSLYNLRNNLVHGHRFDYFDYLSSACDHLQWTVERCLLSELVWQGSSNVDKKNLNRYSAYSKWKTFI